MRRGLRRQRLGLKLAFCDTLMFAGVGYGRSAPGLPACHFINVPFKSTQFPIGILSERRNAPLGDFGDRAWRFRFFRLIYGIEYRELRRHMLTRSPC